MQMNHKYSLVVLFPVNSPSIIPITDGSNILMSTEHPHESIQTPPILHQHVWYTYLRHLSICVAN